MMGEKILTISKDVKTVHQEVACAIPNIDEPGADEVFTYVGQSVAKT